jgi:hypothetical protein
MSQLPHSQSHVLIFHPRAESLSDFEDLVSRFNAVERERSCSSNVTTMLIAHQISSITSIAIAGGVYDVESIAMNKSYASQSSMRTRTSTSGVSSVTLKGFVPTICLQSEKRRSLHFYETCMYPLRPAMLCLRRQHSWLLLLPPPQRRRLCPHRQWQSLPIPRCRSNRLRPKLARTSIVGTTSTTTQRDLIPNQPRVVLLVNLSFTKLGLPLQTPKTRGNVPQS